MSRLSGNVTMRDIREANRQLGRSWFHPDNMRHASCRLGKAHTGPDAYYFVSSERSYDGPRKYTVRRSDHDGSISTAGPYCELDQRKARRLLAWCVANGCAFCTSVTADRDAIWHYTAPPVGALGLLEILSADGARWHVARITDHYAKGWAHFEVMRPLGEITDPK